MIVSLAFGIVTSIRYGESHPVYSNIDQNRTNQPRVTRYKLHQRQLKFASDHKLGSAGCSATRKQNR